MDNIDFGHLFFQFTGRINRAKMWLGWIVLWVILAIVGVAAGVQSTVYSLVNLVLLWPLVALSVKRFQDRDKSGWWVLIGLIPIIGWIWLLVELGFLRGTDGPNQYGPDPLQAESGAPA